MILRDWLPSAKIGVWVSGLFSFIIYILTLAPTITWRNNGVDSGDLATAVAVGGVPHPPGYPTYLLLGEVFKLLPFGDVAYRLNLLSATCAALSITIIGLVISHILAAAHGPGQNYLFYFCAASASLGLAFSPPFWSQAVIAEVYTLNIFFTAILLYTTLRIRSVNERWLIPILFGLLGLSLGNHFSILLLWPMLIGLLKARWCWRLVVAALLAFCLGLSVYLLIPLRAAFSPPLNWGLATSWPNFLWLVSAEPYRQFLFTLPWELVPSRLLAEFYLLTKAFMGWGMPVALLGLLRLSQLNRNLAYGSLLTFCLCSVYSIGYNTTDSYLYLLPAFLMVTLWLGWGLYEVSRILQRFFRPKLHQIGWGLLILPLFSLVLNFSAQNLRQDYQAYTYGQQTLQMVAPRAVIITDDDARTFALWYCRYGLTKRPDVAIIHSSLLPYAWYRQMLLQTHTNLRLSDQAERPLTTTLAFVEQNLAYSPIYLAALHPLSLTGYRQEPFAQLQRVVPLAAD